MHSSNRRRRAASGFNCQPAFSPLAREGALYALRMIEGLRWHPRLIDRDGDIRDRDVISLIGLQVDDFHDEKLTVEKIRNVIAEQRHQVERRITLRVDRLAQNIDKLGNILKLNATERAVLRVAVIATRVRYFDDLLNLTIISQSDLVRALRHATGKRLHDVKQALSEDHTLRRSGFFENSYLPINGSNPLALDAAVVDVLLAHQFDEKRFLKRLVRRGMPSSLELGDFSYLGELDLLKRYLADTTKHRRKGVNLLLYGAPGTGKTEFVRALAPALKLDLYEVPNENANGEPVSGNRRFSAYTICQNLLANRRKQLVLFDEVEDVFGASDSRPGSMFAMFGSRSMCDPDGLKKSWVNETLESNPIPAIWVCNSIEAIDPAFMRRFDLVVEFRTPGRSVRRRIIDRYFRSGEISNACAERLASIAQLPPAQVERSARVSRSLRSRNLATRDAEVERIVSASLRAMGHRKAIALPSLPEHYDPMFLNTDCNLQGLATGLSRNAGARLCLYGPPGTGKTGFAHHLGRMLDRPVAVKRGSELLGMWLGQTEANIADAFDQARTENAILLIDEADGFLRDRAGAHRPWEVTQVNELLTQMEAFEGIFVASTNLVDMLDAASLRRFDFKVRFDYLTREQRREFLRRVACDDKLDSHDTSVAITQIDGMDHLTPGDFANVLRQLKVTGERPTALRIAGLLAHEAAMKPEGRRRGIGFTVA